MMSIWPKSMIYGGRFDAESKQNKIDELDKEMKESNFWDNKRRSEVVISEYNGLSNLVNQAKELKDTIEFHNTSLKEEETGSLEWALEEQEKLQKELESLQMQILLNGEYDSSDAILEVHSGAGGTEACDWAQMLYRMYARWCEKKGYKMEIVDEIPGTEVGFKSISMIVKGHNAYGYLQGEKGIHRLVRISPFDSNARRHTSFAAVEVSPVVDDDIDFEIDEKDLRIDVYRSSGAGGQSVNTTDSAVRITHLPTKTVATCQNERSQLQNKEKCMQILKSKLYELEKETKEKAIEKLKGEHKEINFGSQIRSYVMCPYTLVKDHRNNTEDVNVNKVLDGDIDKFIEAYLKGK